MLKVIVFGCCDVMIVIFYWDYCVLYGRVCVVIYEVFNIMMYLKRKRKMYFKKLINFFLFFLYFKNKFRKGDCRNIGDW